MKKIVVFLALVLVVLSSAVAKTDVDVALSLTDNFFNLGFEAGENKSGSVKPQIGINVDTVVIFDNHNGFNANIGYSMEESILTLAGGYAYTTPVGEMDMILGIGPHFLIKGNEFTFGLDTDVDFKVTMLKSMFFRFGAGADWDFVSFGGGKSEGYFSFNLIVPRVAIGWAF